VNGRARIWTIVAASLALLGVLAPSTAAAAGKRRAPSANGNYIVVFKSSTAAPGEETRRLEKSHGFRSKLRYGRALKGFAAHLSDAQLARVKDDPRVAFVSPDLPVRALAAPLASGETVPSGVLRLGAATATSVRGASGANVAVIDTGVDLAHPDLNVTSGVNCVAPGTAAQDDNGHGTHVAGTIGARNNGSGVVGVAPGTRIYAAKVLDASGGGTQSQVLCGIDWVTGTRTDSDPSNDVAVANMSLGGPGTPVEPCSTTTDAEHLAICRATAAGVTFVVAAGNSGWDFDYAPEPDTPAAYPEVLTVGAMSDSDGKPGAAGATPSCRTGEADDRWASFSNFAATAAGQAHTIAGPGTCINSTAIGGGTAVMSGTSMASPHLAGAVALCIAEGTTAGPCAGRAPADVIQKVRADAQAYNEAHGSYGFSGDPLRPATGGAYFGYLPSVLAPPEPAPAPAPTPTPTPTVTTVGAAPGKAVLQTGSWRSGTVSALGAADASYLAVNSNTTYTRTTAWYGSFAGVPRTLKSLKVSYRGKNSRACTQTVALWSFASGTWVQLDARSVGTTEVLVEKAAGGTLANYVSATGEVRARIRCTTTAGSFYQSANLLRITYTK
jgi:subtilisin family serine protease